MGNLFKKGDSQKSVKPGVVSPDPPKTDLGSSGTKKKRTFKFNIFNVGDLGVGKTSLALKFLGLDFKENVVPDYTIFDSKTKTLELASARCVLSFLDTGGQERFKTITNTAYQRANIIMICFDISRRESFENLSTWFTEALFNNDQCLVVLVGMKVDLLADRQVTTDEANALCKAKCKNGGFYVETSAKSGHHVDYLLQKSCEELVKLIEESVIEMSSVSEG